MPKHHRDSITILLGLEGYRVRAVREEGDKMVVEAEKEWSEGKCPRCGNIRLHRHGKARPRETLHSWARGRRVYFVIVPAALAMQGVQV